MLAAIPSENRLASKSSISLSDLNQQPLILYPPIERAGGFSNYLLRMLHQRGVSARIVQNVEDVITALSLVSSGLGIALGVNSVRNLRIPGVRSEEHTSELQSLMRISYAVFCLKKKINNHNINFTHRHT